MGINNKSLPNQKEYRAPSEKIDIMRRFLNLTPVKRDDCVELDKRLNALFKTCAEYQMIPSVELMSCALSVTRQCIWQWEQEDTPFGNQVRQAKALINTLLTDGALGGDTNFAYVIWLQKNNYGYKENELPTIANDENKITLSIANLPKIPLCTEYDATSKR